MSEATSYRVASLIDMARIPVEAQDRFLAELPVMLDHVRRLINLMENINIIAGVPAPTDADLAKALDGSKWVDDDKGNATTRIILPRENGEPDHELIRIDANYKTGAFKGEVNWPEPSA